MEHLEIQKNIATKILRTIQICERVWNIRILCVLFLINSESFADDRDSSHSHYWKKGAVYQYSALFYDQKGTLLSEGKVILRPSGLVWEIDKKQTLAELEYLFSSDDSLHLAPFPANGVFREWVIMNKEGVMENSTRIWMHPFRSNQYVLTEIAPFPEVCFPLEVNKSWTSKLYIYEGFGTFEGEVNSMYEITSKEKRNYALGTFACWKVESTGTHDKLGISYANYYFNEEIGFMEMNYLFYNKYILKFVLEKFSR